MPFTDRQVKAFKPTQNDQWFSDEKGLRLLVKSNGSKYWRMKYRFGGKQKTLALGVYPEVSLKAARVERDKARVLISDRVDPSEQKQTLKNPQNGQDKFSTLAKLWWENQKGTWTDDHAKRVLKRLEDNSFSLLDAMPIDQIQPPDILKVIRKIEDRGALDVAKRVLQSITASFRFGVQIGQLTYNPATELTGVVKARKQQHRASLPNSQLGCFLSDVDCYEGKGRLVTKLALKLLVLTFVRSGELRNSEWKEFEFDKALWRIPAERMKMRTEHLVPLSKQALSVLLALQPITGDYDLLFPSEKDRSKPMSDNTMRMAIFRLGYDGNTLGKSRATPHGFRANASSILNEQGFNPDAIERQLSHMERNGVRAAYTHHARYMDERAQIMQWWADYLAMELEKV